MTNGEQKSLSRAAGGTVVLTLWHVSASPGGLARTRGAVEAHGPPLGF